MKYIKKLNLRSSMTMLGMVFASAALLIGLTPGKAFAVEATSATNYFAQFNDGRVGWYKITLEKATSGADIGKGRAKITVWCEPNTTPGGTKVACDAIAYGATQGGTGSVGVQYWNETFLNWNFTNISFLTDSDINVDYSPPEAGYSITTPWAFSGEGPDQYLAIVSQFAAASSNQWSQWYQRVTPTWEGTL